MRTLTLCCLLIFGYAQAQIPVASRIDALFTGMPLHNTPGCAVGVIRGDSVLFTKGYGIANLEYGVANTPSSIFNTASMSKQFTAYAVILLAQQKKLSLDDDIRKHLKWFPDLKETITIKNLLNHTSGLRDQWDLAVIAGTDVTTQEQIVKLLSKQRALNFKPGEKYSYSNSNYTLLAEIVAAASGQTFRSFTDSAIFKPLGMSSTSFHDNINEVVKNRAYSYNQVDSVHYENNPPSSAIVGATSLFTSVNDQLKWISIFYSPKVGDKKSIELLTQRGKLNNGQSIDYGAGLYIENYKGWKVFQHGGGEAGYVCHMSVYPELKTGIVVLCNNSNIDAQGKVKEIANLLLTERAINSSQPKTKARDSATTVLKDPTMFKEFVGTYMSETGIKRSISLKDGRLYVVNGNQPSLLYPLTRDTFSLFAYSTTRLALVITKEHDTLLTRNDNYAKYELKKFTEVVPSNAILQSYAGSYFCPELECTQNIEYKEGKVVLKYPKFDIPLNPIGNDYLVNGYTFRMLRDGNKAIVGFEINGDRTLHLRFNKVK